MQYDNQPNVSIGFNFDLKMIDFSEIHKHKKSLFLQDLGIVEFDRFGVR